MSIEMLGKDNAGSVDFTLAGPVACFDAPLVANTVLTTTSPPNFNRAFFSFSVGTNVWVTLDGTAPVKPVSAGASTQELLPSGRQINISGSQVIKCISDTTGWVNIRYDLGQAGAAG